MADDPKPGTPEWYEQRMQGLSAGGACWGHRHGQDPRTPEEREAAERQERARRKGRRRREWWKATESP